MQQTLHDAYINLKLNKFAIGFYLQKDTFGKALTNDF